MKRLLLIVPVLGLAACAGQHPSSTTTSAAYPSDALPEDMREPSHVHTYLVNDYIDPNNPRLRHRGHPVDVVEQDEKWNLSPTDANDGNYGPTTTVEAPNAAANPYSAEFETELAQQRDQYKQLASIGTQMTTEMERLKEMAVKEADAVSENASLRNRLEELQREVDELKPPPTPPVAPNAPKKPSWLDSLWDLFQQVPKGTPVVQTKPVLRTNAALQSPDMPSSLLPSAGPPPEVLTTPPDAPTNAPDEIPSPGEMAQPLNNPSNDNP
jgi:hypothetical protein